MKARAGAVLLLAAVLFAAAPAAGPVAGETINKTAEDVAIEGFDTVAYFTVGRPVEGKPEFEYRWQDAKWRFASAEHRDLFASDPEGYAPRYGGHCTGAMSRGVLWTIDPEAWAIVEGRLYLNYRKAAIEGFVENPGPVIEQADANWQRLQEEN